MIPVLHDAVLHRLEEPPRRRDRRAVRQVPAVPQRLPHDDAARLDHREVRGQVGLGAAVRLDVGVRHAEEPLSADDGQLLRLVHDLAAAVVPLPGVPLRVLVVERRGHRGQHRRRREVLGGDQLEAAGLAVRLPGDDSGDDGVGGEQVGMQRQGLHSSKIEEGPSPGNP
jgi:hypothetical protein